MQMVLWCALCFHSGPKQSCFIRTTSMEACRSLKKLPQGHHDPDHGHSLVQHNVTLVLCSVGRERLRQAIERHDVIVMRQLSGILGWADDSEKNCALCCLPSSRLWLLDVARSDLTCFVDSDDSWMYCSNTEITWKVHDLSYLRFIVVHVTVLALELDLGKHKTSSQAVRGKQTFAETVLLCHVSSSLFRVLFYSILFYPLLFYSILFCSILLYSTSSLLSSTLLYLVSTSRRCPLDTMFFWASENVT